MNKINELRICIAATACLATSAFAQSEVDARLDELNGLVQSLRAEIAELRADDDTWLNETRAEEIRALVHDVLADADTRASLLQGMQAGYDGGFMLGSGDFTLKMNGQIQTRYVWNSQDRAPMGDDDVNGFEIRRAKLKFKGNMFGKDWKYNIVGAFDRDGGAFELEDAEIIYAGLADGGAIRVGQYKPPVLREELISSSRQQAADRSLVNEEFNQSRSQGIEYSNQGDQLGFAVMYHDGIGRPNTPALVEGTEWGGLAARVEYLGAGSWSQFKGMSGFPGSEYGMLLGGAVNFQKDKTGATETENLILTGDVSLQWDGASLFAYLVYQTLDDDAAIDADRYGMVVQGGYFVSSDMELFARYEYGDYDSATVEDLSVITVGLNKYWEKHGLKWTTDIGFGLDDIASPWASSGAGYRTDAPGEDGQVVFRSQLQLLF